MKSGNNKVSEYMPALESDWNVVGEFHQAVIC
jgi:hypothetical protein